MKGVTSSPEPLLMFRGKGRRYFVLLTALSRDPVQRLVGPES